MLGRLLSCWWSGVSTWLFVCLLAAFHIVWCCLAISSAVRDSVEERRLRQRQPVRTCPAVDRGGAFSMAELPRCGTSSEDSAGDFFGLLARWRRIKTRGKQRDDLTCSGDLAAWFGSRGAGHLFLLPWWQFMLPGGRRGCSSTAAMGPARRWPSSVRWCLPLCSFSVADHFSGFDTCKCVWVEAVVMCCV
jgi:hypothetical protein